MILTKKNKKQKKRNTNKKRKLYIRRLKHIGGMNNLINIITLSILFTNK